MSDFSKITFEPPGYPIYRAFMIPYRQGEDLLDVVEVGAKEMEQWREMLRRLKNFLSKAIKAMPAWGELKDYERVELLGDLIPLFLRAPLNREILPSIAPSPLKAYAFMRFTLMRFTDFKKFFEEWKRLELDVLGFTSTFYDQYSKYLREGSQVGDWYYGLAEALNELEAVELAELLESCWLLIPADTRPILNSSSLIPHLLLTSAIAWSIAINEGIKDRKSVACLRLAALLHDVGKPFNYRHHVEVSVEVAKELMSDLLPEEDIKLISELIKEHHHPKTPLSDIIKRADEIASTIDRLKKLLDEPFKNIKERLEGVAKVLNYDSFDSAFNDWDFWRRIYEEYDKNLIRDLSKEFVREVRKMTKNFTVMLPRTSDVEEKPKNLKIVLIDIGGVQNFIYRSHSLKQVAAASLVMDSLVMAYIVTYLQWTMSEKCWLPYESFLYTAGGNVELLIPEALLSDVENEILKLSENEPLMVEYGIPLRVVSAELHEDYSKTIKELMAKMAIRKISVNLRRYHIAASRPDREGVRSLCQFCFMEPPVRNIPTPEGMKGACKACGMLNDIGLNIHFKNKYDSKLSIDGKLYSPREVFEMPWSEEEASAEGVRVNASDKIMEIIAGHDLEELKELGEKARIRNVAVIKVDGVLTGPLMATCLSIADAYERSARIDLALKKAIEKAIHEVYKGVLSDFSEKEAARAAISIKMGLLYAGGDDALILAPSWASPLIALVLGKEFLYNFGCVRGLSMGMAIANPKANIWALIDASSKLIEKAKEGKEGKARRSVEEGPAESVLYFDVIEVGDLSSSTVSERFATLERERLTVQPITIREFEEMLCKVLAQGQGVDGGKYSYSDIARLSYLASRNAETLKATVLVEEVKRIQKNLKRIRNAIGETLQAARSMISKVGGVKQYSSYLFSIAYIYACRQFARLEDRSYEFVRLLVPDVPDNPSSLSDVDRLIKIIGGGLL